MQQNLVNERAVTHQNKALSVIVREVKQLFVMFVYLWILFLLFDLYEVIILRQRGIEFAPKSGFALINALVLAKVMLVVEDLDLARWVRRAPIYKILAECGILTASFLCFNVLEHMVIGYFEHKTVAASLPMIGGGGLIGLGCVSVIMFFSVMPFVACRHISRQLGPGRLRAMLLGRQIASNP